MCGCTVARRRLNEVTKQFHETGEVNTERRGGSRQTEVQKECTESIIAFIKKQKVVEGHYNRAKSSRQYLSHDLNVSKLYRIWLAERRADEKPITKPTKFADIFYEKFNLGFGQPKTDVCSTCKTLAVKSKEGTEEVRKENKLLLDLHTIRWKKFYKLLEDARCKRDTLAIVFDLQQTQPLPRTNVSEAFYRRQLWVYNLAVVIHSHTKKQPKNNVFLYTWLESQSGRGSNEVTSILQNALHKLKNRIRKYRYRHLALFSDSCSGQNKNKAMIAFLLKYANSKEMKFRDITFTFPIRGHSYLPPDRVFGRIEREIRKKEDIVSPQQYYDIFQNHGKVRVFPRHWQVFDYKELAESTLMNCAKLKLRDSRIWKFKKNSPTVAIAVNNYGLVFNTFNVLKKKLAARKPKLVKSQSHISVAKLRDVRYLIQLVNLNPEEKAFYANLKSSINVKDDLRHPVECDMSL